MDAPCDEPCRRSGEGARVGAASGQGESTGPLLSAALLGRPAPWGFSGVDAMQRLGWGGNTGGSCCGLGLRTQPRPSRPDSSLLPPAFSVCLWLRPAPRVLCLWLRPAFRVSCPQSPGVGSLPAPVGLRPRPGPALSPVRTTHTRPCTLGSPLGPLVHFWVFE